jgi:hypothetical protein
MAFLSFQFLLVTLVLAVYLLPRLAHVLEDVAFDLDEIPFGYMIRYVKCTAKTLEEPRINSVH